MDEQVPQRNGSPDPTASHVLVVDDDLGIRQMLIDVLEEDGLTVSSAAHGAAALAHVEELQPDLILLDARMPILDGFATCAQIRTRSNGTEVPILMITALSDSASVEHAFAVGADDVLFKPLHIALLRARVRQILQARRDALARRDTEARLLANEEYLRALVEHSAEIITVVDADGAVRYSSPALRRLLGYTGAESSSHMFLQVHPDDQPLVARLVEQLMGASEGVMTTELRVRHYDGSWRVFEATGANLLGNPAVRGIVVNSHDITEHKRVAEQLAHDAFHDALTGLPNRALFLNRLVHALDRGIRAHDRRCAVLFLDLDRFKDVNDSLGHQAGNQLLVNVARRLEGCVRPGDTVARLGGDDFTILLEDLASADTATAIVARITAAFEAPFELEGREIVTSASIGIAISAPGGAHPDDLLRDADIAMYSAKRGGPGQYALADPSMHAAIMARLQMEADLQLALEREEFVLHYQPIMSIDGRTMDSVEVLMRWRHPERGMVAPLDFIPLAEETGLIVPIGAWALRTACAQARAWHTTGFPPVCVAVNLSARQFKQPDIAATIRDILAETGLEPRYLCLELTEGILMEDAEATVTALHELRGAGIGSLAIDDFGTGYSSLSYLQRFPVTAIKIDRSFVRDIMTNPSNAAIATSTIALAHSLGLEAVAEGVETEAQRDFLERAGCDRFQGWLISPAAPADQLAAFARARFQQG